MILNSNIIFTANNNFGNGLWKTDGTSSGTTLLKQFPLSAVLFEVLLQANIISKKCPKKNNCFILGCESKV